MKWVILIGDVVVWFDEDGNGPLESIRVVEVLGPFDTEQEAVTWRESLWGESKFRTRVVPMPGREGYVLPWNRPDPSDLTPKQGPSDG